MDIKTYGLKKCGATPSYRQMEWYQRERTVFFHFGMNTFSDREWGDGTENPKDFNPTALDCRQWIRTIKNAGFTTAIITAKHHDGFCLWPTAYSEHSIKNSPYKNGKGDIVREFTDACREYNIKAGIYLSPWDRHEKTWGSEEYNDYYANQLKELMSNYGKIWECWWDGAGSTEAHYDWGKWAYIVRDYQPDAVIFGSLGATPYVEVRWVGNENGMSGDPCWSTIDGEALFVEETSRLNSGKLGGDRFIPAEADVSIRPGWFYHSNQDIKVRSPKNLVNLWFESIGKNSGLLLNFPPDRRGLINEVDVKNINKFNEILKKSTCVNLASSSNIVADEARCKECAPQMMLNDDKDKFYSPVDNCKNPEIIFEFDEKITFNAFEISELIELGHKITAYEIFAYIDNKYISIFKGKCVGYRWMEHFESVTTDKVKLCIIESLDVPAIRKFALYKFDDELFEPDEIEISSGEDILKENNSVVEVTDDGIEVNMGGIFPFNTIVFNGDGIRKYEIYVFNGTSYQLLKKGLRPTKKNVCKFNKVNYAYKFKIKVIEKSKEITDPQVEAYFEK